MGAYICGAGGRAAFGEPPESLAQQSDGRWHLVGRRSAVRWSVLARA